MRFIGNKELITPEIKKLLELKNLSGKGLTLLDAFCGTGAVSVSLQDSFNIIANDILRWCTIYTKGRVCAKDCKFERLGFDPITFFNTNTEILEGFFYRNYSPGGSERMYFSAENAGRVDFFRTKIEEWKDLNLINESEYSYLLACLIESVSHVSNTAGVYGAFLKHWDSRALKKIQFRVVDSNNSTHNEIDFLNSKIEDVISEVECDILYLDPPYTQNQYGTQYHLLETLVLYDSPSISKITGSRKTAPMRSDWSKEYKAHILFDEILAKTKAKHILFSYSQDGLMSKSFIEASLKRYGIAETYVCKNISYRKYTNFKSKASKDHKEFLFYVEMKSEVQYESPLNYIGSKARMISTIKAHLPADYNSFIDAFGGGFNVGVNINASRIVYNDINNFVSELVASFKKNEIYSYILYIKKIIKKYNLEPANSESYLKLRDYYNSLPLEKRDPKLLYTVVLYGFNQQIRFNGKHDFNNPVGMRWFNDKVLEKMISFSRVIKEKHIIFESKDYSQLYYEADKNTFTYLDPPYMLTTGSYNDGKRGFEGWSEVTEKKLFNFADKLNDEGKLFMISYVMEHKGRINNLLKTWIKNRKYQLINLDPIVGNDRKEILITNFKKNAKSNTSLQNKEQISEKN
ncbi:MAG TPA: Dam family site-specific DNA-(adenine-N6)-methyltransferase [Methylophilus sp.]|uniref:Dam family site-specific DNA-(adenine-N6)-methyltransferase n=1 Tax=Methylophilus sp. TaxID=29541 RepID=UPI002C019CD6|nr:Dam family site-specific DNA-(adenine-N6)-methyltransferase [Methylophilus sp.]HSH87600.1 Dam family site-specific DNA-(adenine-N6)-methyltransferase [Methylophilus sp.]